jgi:DNA-binding GntR family transcriptional regulator
MSETRPEPRYAILREELQGRIQDGTYRVGDLLPTELELQEEFGLSRHTVREALRQLIDMGLVRRRQGSGTQVVRSAVEQNYVHSMRSLSELFQYASNTHFRIDSIDEAVPGPELAAIFQDEATSVWLRIEGIRWTSDDSTTICLSTVFLHSAFKSLAARLPDHRGAIYQMVEDEFGVSLADVEQNISAEPIDSYVAKRLGVSVKLWTVRVVRRYLDADGKLLLVSVNHHPADRFSYAMHLRRESAKGWN